MGPGMFKGNDPSLSSVFSFRGRGFFVWYAKFEEFELVVWFEGPIWSDGGCLSPGFGFPCDCIS
jgi:hypothetical protein